MGASERNLSIHEKCRASQSQPDRPFRDTRCLTWLSTGPRYRAMVVCSHRLQSCRYFLTKFLCHTVCRRFAKGGMGTLEIETQSHKYNHRSSHNIFSYVYFRSWASVRAERKLKTHRLPLDVLCFWSHILYIQYSSHLRPVTSSECTKSRESHLFSISSVFLQWWPKSFSSVAAFCLVERKYSAKTSACNGPSFQEFLSSLR